MDGFRYDKGHSKISCCPSFSARSRIDRHRPLGIVWDFEQFAEAMDEIGPFFLGKEPSLVGFVLAPGAVRLWVFDHYKGGLVMPAEGQGGAHGKSWSRWRKWLTTIEERRSIHNTTSEREDYLPLYQR